MKILLLSKYSRMGASSRLRTLQYLPYLAAHGVEVTARSLFDDTYLNDLYASSRRSPLHVAGRYGRRLLDLLQTGRHDLLWVEKELFPYFPATAEVLLRKMGVNYVVDYDDAIFHHYDLSRRKLLRSFMGDKIDRVMRHSACVVAGNDYLAERARQAGAPRMEIIPTVVDHTRYALRPAQDMAQPVIGWIGSPSTQEYLLTIRDALFKACAQHRARLVLVGATPKILQHFDGLDVELLRWTENTEAQSISRFDVGIMPLQDGPWEKGKCGYKLIQYMACGIPVIASAVGANVPIVRGSGAGMLANSSAEWEQAFSRLLASATERQALGRLGRAAVEQTYSLQAQAPALLKIFSSLC